MALVKTLNKHTPSFGDNCFLADNATIIGDVVIGNYSSVWFNTVIRGDVNSIRIGNRVNVQDSSVIHCSYKRAATQIGDNVTIGHSVIIHGCTLKDNVLVGMGSIVMDNAVIGEYSMIAAGSVVLENQTVESGSLYAGIPARKIRTLSEEQIEMLIGGTADNYVKYAEWYR